ncbi:MAG: acyltransferase [Candidatus Cloacimonetes bacterium]|nr:acyltransferase [Candidatus Cloacimonadota bacterium]
MSNARYFPELNLLRGMAIIAVICIHVTAKFVQMDTFNTTTILNLMADALFQFAVPLFIFISGFVLTARYKGSLTENADFKYGTFYRKRFRKILPGYLLFSLIYYFVPFLSEFIHGIFNLTFFDFAGKMLLARCHGNLWFVALIMQFYLLFPFLLKLFSRFNKKDFFLASCFIIQLFWLICINHINKIATIPQILKFTIFDKRLFLSHIGFFMLGCWTETNRKKLLFLSQNRKSIIAFFLFYSLTVFYWIWGLETYGEWSLIPAGFMDISIITMQLQFFFVILFLYNIALNLSKRESSFIIRKLNKAGKFSFPIYLSHCLYLMGYEYLLKRAGVSQNSLSFFLLLFGLTLISSYATAPQIERIIILKSE